MGLFGSIFKGIKKAVGGVAKVASFGLKSGLVPLPFGGTAGRLVGGLLHAKAPGGHTSLKMQIPTLILRAKSASMKPINANGLRVPTATQLRRSPVMPGGSVATRKGIVSRPAIAPMSLGGSGTSTLVGGKRKRRKRAAGSTRRRSRASYGGKRTKRRKLKFGSPAWRKKYLGHGRKRRKRRAA